MMSQGVVNRTIHELRRFWAAHPRYPDLVNNIQGKYAFTERPQYGIVVKSSGISNTPMDLSNVTGTVISHLSLKRVGQ
ncbi:MAG: hypothetical protein AAGM67_07345, partial [Bacteroidota bacterium]